MRNQRYKNQVRLLLDVLPEVAREEYFALHGGTAINLFVRDMPRLSVDIDLTYLPIEGRESSFSHIDEALKRIGTRIGNILPRAQVFFDTEPGKLLIRADGAEIKLEVNLVMRGTISPSKRMILCEKAQTEYDVSVIMPVVPLGQLYGGKICAALDRQHPRDLFDVKHLLEVDGFSDSIRQGFLFSLLCSKRPIHEVLFPRFRNQRLAMENQFAGMSDIPFTYADFEDTREYLVNIIHENLMEADKAFLLAFKKGEPDWRIHDFERFPAIQWKLQNLRGLRENNPVKHEAQYQALEIKLNDNRFKNGVDV